MSSLEKNIQWQFPVGKHGKWRDYVLSDECLPENEIKGKPWIQNILP